MGASLDYSIQSMVEKLDGCNPLVAQLPVGEGELFSKIIDLVTMELISWTDEKGEVLQRIPVEQAQKDGLIKKELAERAVEARAKLVEQLGEIDDHVADEYLTSGAESISPDLVRKALRRATLEQKGVVVLCGASFKNKGVQPVMDAIIDYLPSPLEVPNAKASLLPSFSLSSSKQQAASSAQTVNSAPATTNHQVEVVTNPKGPLCALAFKVIHDPHRGPLVFLRVYSGTLSARTNLINVTRREKERPNKLLQMFANMSEEIPEIQAGNIGAATGLKFTCTGDTLLEEGARAIPVNMILAGGPPTTEVPSSGAKGKHQDLPTVFTGGSPVLLEGVKIPRPVFFCAIEPESSSQEKQLEEALTVLQKEDPSFNVGIDKDSGQTLVSGMGELHLEIIRDRLTKEFGLEVQMGKVQISYRETPVSAFTLNHEFSRQFGNKQASVSVWISVSPAVERGAGSSLIADMDKIDESRCSPSVDAVQAVLPFIKQGFEDALMKGPLLGFSLEDVQVRLLGADLQGSSPNSDICQVAFRAAMAEAISSAVSSAGVRLLEPQMLVEVTTDSEYVGDVVSNITGSRRGRVRSIDFRQGEQVVTAEVPLSEMIGYSTSLRSITHGHSSFFMEFLNCSEVSPQQQEKIVKEIRGF